jgi:protein-disulfide isomerase-like protein with CxxC motif
MNKEPEAMRQIHRIQERIYEETKDMISDEFLEYIHNAAEEARKKYGLKLKKATRVR